MHSANVINICPKQQCRGLTTHSSLRHHTPVWAIELHGVHWVHGNICGKSGKADHTLLRCYISELAVDAIEIGRSVASIVYSAHTHIYSVGYKSKAALVRLALRR